MSFPRPTSSQRFRSRFASFLWDPAHAQAQLRGESRQGRSQGRTDLAEGSDVPMFQRKRQGHVGWEMAPDRLPHDLWANPRSPYIPWCSLTLGLKGSRPGYLDWPSSKFCDPSANYEDEWFNVFFGVGPAQAI